MSTVRLLLVMAVGPRWSQRLLRALPISAGICALCLVTAGLAGPLNRRLLEPAPKVHRLPCDGGCLCDDDGSYDYHEYEAKHYEPKRGAMGWFPRIDGAQAGSYAVKHWQAGLAYFQNDNDPRAKAEWLLCKRFDPANADCQRGLQRLDAEPAAVDYDGRAATRHWQSGITYFQKGDVSKARDEWLLCKQFDAGNPDCLNGLQRIDQVYGGGT